MRKHVLGTSARRVVGGLLVAIYIATGPFGPWLHGVSHCPCDGDEAPNVARCGHDVSCHRGHDAACDRSADGPWLVARALGRHADEACPFVRFQHQQHFSGVAPLELAGFLLSGPCAPREQDFCIACAPASFDARAPPA